ncbi:hypothetical protein [Listeria welshimeri]|uniref:hypothetical protein n=1 Tax=Listeria welshimeri TaxID=1643 RepID=UPI0018896B12|nr:hypothetical protein [Listeria welshimeri]MBF2387372.1 hypothetical protein [Listeria welshimeri]MBF2462128.1 hypothetical protein [Listeria welshimeri]MBF2483198.1 hypothetical protein [Listeria welshimeri]MBF2636464.1 hypothetical protein [Listeria welshimeri]MBF2684029.1 hypothetical protein [Listeria welshimeri]
MTKFGVQADFFSALSYAGKRLVKDFSVKGQMVSLQEEGEEYTPRQGLYANLSSRETEFRYVAHLSILSSSLHW